MPDDLPADLPDPNRYSLSTIVHRGQLYQRRPYRGVDREGRRSWYWVKMDDTPPASPRPTSDTYTPRRGEVRSALPQPDEEPE